MCSSKSHALLPWPPVWTTRSRIPCWPHGSPRPCGSCVTVRGGCFSCSCHHKVELTLKPRKMFPFSDSGQKIIPGISRFHKTFRSFLSMLQVRGQCHEIRIIYPFLLKWACPRDFHLRLKSKVLLNEGLEEVQGFLKCYGSHKRHYN